MPADLFKKTFIVQLSGSLHFILQLKQMTHLNTVVSAIVLQMTINVINYYDDCLFV